MQSSRIRILVAPDKFKGSLGAAEVAKSISAGLRDVLPNAIIEIAPVADGGEGTAEVIRNALGGTWVRCGAHDPVGRAIAARYAWIPERRLAVIEMSEAAGMRRLRESERDPLRASTFGVGEMLLAAIKRGAHEIMAGLGGSATNDGGLGMARALGFKFLRIDGGAIESVGELFRFERIEKPAALSLPEIIAAADVRNPLLGESGATRVFGPQKGANPDEIEILERALWRLADIVARDLHLDHRDVAGAGAAGGLGFGLMSFCSAQLRSGFDVVAKAIDLEEKVRKADVIVTGEGKLDSQTLGGKAPAGVAQLARRHGKLVYAIVGQADANPECPELFDGIYELARRPIITEEAMNRTAGLLRERAREFGLKLQC
jgi:glycerate kinase